MVVYSGVFFGVQLGAGSKKSASAAAESALCSQAFSSEEAPQMDPGPSVCLKHRWIGPCPCQADTAQGAQQPQQDGGTGSRSPPCCPCLWCISSLAGLVGRNEMGKCISSKYETLNVLIPQSISLSLPCASWLLRGLVPPLSPDVARACSRGGIWGARGRGAPSPS